MKILIAGSSGFIGKELTRYLTEREHSVIFLVRDQTKLDESHYFWDPLKGKIDTKALEKVDVVINLSGENIGKNRWTEKVKKRILESRLQATKTLVAALSTVSTPPQLVIQPSAVGFYGDSKDRLCREHSAKGEGFLADVCVQWEDAAKPLVDLGIRLVIFRLGMVLSAHDGVLAKILPPFQYFLGGKLGNGRQYMSWIAMDDLLSAFDFALTHKDMEGTINLVAPTPITNATFTEALSKILHRPALFSIPAWLLHFVLGTQRADELLLSSIRADSSCLESFGYRFQYPEIEQALKHICSVAT